MASALFLKIGQCLEKAGFTEVDFIAFAIMSRAITPLGTQRSDLETITIAGEQLASQTSQRMSLTTSTSCFVIIFIG